jgi:hypothetical protein
MRLQAPKVKTPNLLVPLIRLALVTPPAVLRPQTHRLSTKKKVESGGSSHNRLFPYRPLSTLHTLLSSSYLLVPIYSLT